MRKQRRQREKMIILLMGIIFGVAAYNLVTALCPLLGWILILVDFCIYCIKDEIISWIQKNPQIVGSLLYIYALCRNILNYEITFHKGN